MFCEQCGLWFEKNRYRRHLTMHREAWMKCLHCEKTFNRRVQLVRHLIFHITPKIKPFYCKICNYSNDRKGNVADHVKKVHKKEWSNEDIRTDKEELALMRKIAVEQADIVMGYKEVMGNKGKMKVLKGSSEPINKFNRMRSNHERAYTNVHEREQWYREDAAYKKVTPDPSSEQY